MMLFLEEKKYFLELKEFMIMIYFWNKSKIKDALMSAVSNSKPDSITAKSELIAELDKKMLEESLAK